MPLRRLHAAPLSARLSIQAGLVRRLHAAPRSARFSVQASPWNDRRGRSCSVSKPSVRVGRADCYSSSLPQGSLASAGTTDRGWCNWQHIWFWSSHWGFESSPPSSKSARNPNEIKGSERRRTAESARWSHFGHGISDSGFRGQRGLAEASLVWVVQADPKMAVATRSAASDCMPLATAFSPSGTTNNSTGNPSVPERPAPTTEATAPSGVLRAPIV